MNRAVLPQKQQPDPDAEDHAPLARSIGQILHDHLDEIVGPETAAKVRLASEKDMR